MGTDALVLLLVAIFAAPCESDDGRCVSHLQEISAIKLDLEKPVDYDGAWEACDDRGLDILVSFGQLNDTERALCGDQLVPYDLPLDQEHPGNTDETDALAVNLTSGQRQIVDDNFTFTCVLCQLHTFEPPLRTPGFIDDLTPTYYFKVHLTQANLKDNVTMVSKTKLAQELYERLRSDVMFDSAWLDDSQRLHVEYRVHRPMLRSIVTGDKETSIFNDTFFMRVEDVSVCAEGQTVDVDGAVTLWPKVYLFWYDDSYQFVTNASTGVITRRDCHFNHELFHGVWLPRLSRWELVWKVCSLEEEFTNEDYYIQFLNSSDIERRHAEVLHNFTLGSVDKKTLQTVAHFVDNEIKAHNELSERTVQGLAAITAKLKLVSDFFVAAETRASLVVADLKGNEPAEGFTLRFDPFSNNMLDTIVLNRKLTVQGQDPFALDVSARLLEAHTRVAFVVVWKDIQLAQNINKKQKVPAYQYLEVSVMFPIQNEVSAWSFASYGNHHVDITYDVSVMLCNPDDVFLFNFLACVAWNNNLRDWTSQGCKMLYIEKGNFSACRCSGKYFVMQDGVPIARFALKKGLAADKEAVQNNLLVEFLKDKPGLMTATAIECLLSVLGLGSIISTAVWLKDWRKNTGHKILLHMVLALTCNLVLGFTASFVHMTTENVGCLVYGVLRHYSFLAMFLWMLVLSCLQLKRLTTVAGAKAISHLVLKVSVFAWGVPLVPIIFLLSCNPGFYQTDRFDRGYCYPEKIVFKVTVQVPAGFIMFVNFCIFIKIVMHIFECRGEKKITRHSKNKKAEQLNKLKTSIFIFFLFGFSWVFHIFSEERVIVSDFLFEYLFLMTATTHIFVLSLFFVVLQEATRNYWATAIKNSSRSFREKLGM